VKKTLSVILSLLMLVGIFTVAVLAAPDGGFTVSQDFIEPVTHKTTVPEGFVPIYEVSDFFQLFFPDIGDGPWMPIIGGEPYIPNPAALNAKCILMNDLDLSPFIFDTDTLQINLSWGTADAPFTGVFDGNGYSISGFSSESSGFFGVTDGAVIKNLALTNVDITIENATSPDFAVGALVDSATSTTIENCYVTGSITVTATNNGSPQDDNVIAVGGLVGIASDTVITKCYSAVDIDAVITGAILTAGGIVGGFGGQSSSVQICYNSGDISASVDAMFFCLGGIAGIQSAAIKNCFNLGSLNNALQTNTAMVGGIVGYHTYPVIWCYNTGVISTSPSISKKEIVGEYPFIQLPIVDPNKIVSQCYFNKDIASVIDWPVIKGLTDAQMRQQSSFAGFNFENIWAMPDGGGYPVFKSMVSQSEPQGEPEPQVDPEPMPTPSNGSLTQWLNNFIKSIMMAIIKMLTFGLL